MITNCNEVVVLQRGGHSSNPNSKPADEEVMGTRKERERQRDIGEKGSEGAFQEKTFNYFPGPLTKDLDLFM